VERFWRECDSIDFDFVRDAAHIVGANRREVRFSGGRGVEIRLVVECRHLTVGVACVLIDPH